jgi:anti-sigma regulatory factor (Ser/Thr protein kinase)
MTIVAKRVSTRTGQNRDVARGRADRKKALDMMAAGLGHDLGNLILPISAQLDIIQARGGSDVQESVASLRQTAEYLRALTHGLRLATLDAEDRAASDPHTELGPWWSTVAALFKTLMVHGVRLEHDIPATLPPVHVEPHRLTQAVLNLLSNAVCAIGTSAQRGGRIGTVRVSAAEGAPGRVHLSVADNGPGMTAEVRRRCMEPRFTTKGGRGMGLGLALVSRVATEAGGSIELDSETGRGTIVVMSFPIAQPVAPPDADGVVAGVLIRDARVRALVKILLASAKFRVAADTQDRADAFAGGPEPSAWVVDDGHLAAEPVRRFLQREAPGPVVVVGSRAVARAPMASVTVADPRDWNQMSLAIKEAVRRVRLGRPAVGNG